MIKNTTYALVVLLCTLAGNATAQALKKVNIKGTKVYIVAPKGFEPATAFNGLQTDSAAIQVYDLAGGNYNENAATFSRAKFEAKGIKVLDYKETKVAGYPAKYAHITKGGMEMYNLVFGDTTFSAMLVGMFPEHNQVMGKAIKQAIFSATYDKNFKVDHMALAPFTVDDSQSRFKYAMAANNLYAYSIGGKEDSGGDEPVILFIQVPVTPSMTPESLGAAMAASVAKYGAAADNVKNKWTGTVNGLEAYEAELYGETEGKKNMVYQLVVKNSEKAIVVMAIAKSDFEKLLVEFKALAKTVRIK
ncbi:MAG: hypothetical protein V4649_18850 [Bacteroidota bacterium]